MKLEAICGSDHEGKDGTRETLHGNNAESRRDLQANGEWDLLGDVRSDGARGRIWTERLPVRFVWLAAA